MEAHGLVVSRRYGNAFLFTKNSDYAHIRLLEAILTTSRGAEPAASQERLRAWLKALGAPLTIAESSEGMPKKEAVIAQGLKACHADSTLTRAFPLLLWRQRACVDFAELVNEATRIGEKQTLGFLLDVTGKISGDRTLTAKSIELRDARIKRVRDFFPHASGRRARELADLNSPACARKWKFRINMSLETFAQLFAKHEATDGDISG